jgi:hypothetical protein
MFKQTSELMFFAICSWIHGRVILSEEEEKGMVSEGCKKTLVVSCAHDTNRNRNVISFFRLTFRCLWARRAKTVNA